MKQEQLLDSYYVNTADYNRAIEVLRDLTDSLEIVQIKTNDISLASYVEDTDDDKILIALNKQSDSGNEKLSRRTGLPSFYNFDRNQLTKNGTLDVRFLDEFKSVGFLLYINKSLYNCGSAVLGTLGTRTELSGDGLTKKSILRDALITERLGKDKKKCTVIMRKSEDNIPKIFAVLGKAYCHIPQLIVKDIAELASTALETDFTMTKFEATNYFSRMYLEFPAISDEFAKIYELPEDCIPGICISTSDTGDSSLSIYATIRTESLKSPFFVGEYSRKHSGDVNLTEVMDNIKNNVFPEFTKFPEILNGLIKIKITDPARTIEKVIKKINLSNLIGKENAKALQEAYIAEFDPSVTYTAYDIATTIASSADRIKGLPSTLLLKFQKEIKSVMFLDYEGIEKETSLYLTA